LAPSRTLSRLDSAHPEKYAKPERPSCTHGVSRRAVF
jgi:hypothetical protein